MRASRLAAVGLVAGAALWIGSGYFMPHDSNDSRAAVQPSEHLTSEQAEGIRDRRKAEDHERLCEQPVYASHAPQLTEGAVAAI